MDDFGVCHSFTRDELIVQKFAEELTKKPTAARILAWQRLKGEDVQQIARVDTISGKTTEELQLIQTKQQTYDRYDFVWTAAGEDGLQLGRACILDDGNYHYALSTLTRESASADLRETFSQMYDSCRLIAPDVNLSTGS